MLEDDISSEIDPFSEIYVCFKEWNLFCLSNLPTWVWIDETTSNWATILKRWHAAPGGGHQVKPLRS